MVQNDTSTIRLLVVDDHEVVRTGLDQLLSAKGTNFTIVASTQQGEEAVALAAQHRPDVILLDIRMQEVDGLSLLERMGAACPQAAKIMLSCYDNPTYIARALVLGASDYVLKDAPLEQLVEAIQRAANRQSPSDQSVTIPIQAAMKSSVDVETAPIHFSSRERQVLRHLALGLSNKEMARSLAISVDTVKEHVQNVLRKLGVTDRTQAAVWAVRQGFLPGISPAAGDT